MGRNIFIDWYISPIVSMQLRRPSNNKPSRGKLDQYCDSHYSIVGLCCWKEIPTTGFAYVSLLTYYEYKLIMKIDFAIQWNRMQSKTQDMMVTIFIHTFLLIIEKYLQTIYLNSFFFPGYISNI